MAEYKKKKEVLEVSAAVERFLAADQHPLTPATGTREWRDGWGKIMKGSK